MFSMASNYNIYYLVNLLFMLKICKIIYYLSAPLAVIDALLGICILYLLGGFENGLEWLCVSSVISLGIVAACCWLFWRSLQELKNLQRSETFHIGVEEDVVIEPPPTEAQEPIVESSNTAVAVHDVKGFDRLSVCGKEEYSLSELTAWLRKCRETAAYPLALPCDGRVFADVRQAGFSNIWVIGDVHGDLNALTAVFAFADEWTRNNSADAPTVISLGDLFDRGEKSMETIIKFLGEAKKRTGRVGWIAGNHDFGFHFEEQRAIFASRTYPNEFTMWLNSHLEDETFVAFGREVAALCGKLPSAAVIPGDILLVHGGVPHKDLQERIASLADLEDSDMRHDFVWGRFHESLKRKRPSREANCQMGVQDVYDFLSILEKNCGIACKAILRGHDHFAERIRIYEAYAPRSVITLNTCSTLKDGAYSSKQLDFTPPAVVHCFKGAIEAFRILK